MDHITVTAVVPMYRGESTIAESLRSLLQQEIEGLEILVFDDGSPDQSAAVVEQMCLEVANERLVLYRHPNRGLAATLNRGVELAKGQYIARQDQDDLVLAHRLAKQKAFLDAHPEIAMVGTWAQIYVGDTPTDRYHRHPASPDALRLFLLFDNPFVHSSMMLRTAALRAVGGYSEDKSRQPPEDYELWSRIARKFKVANLPEVLTVYREMPGSMSRDGAIPFLPKILRISAENLHALIGTEYSLDSCMSLACLYHNVAQAPRTLKKADAMRMLQAAVKKIVPADQKASAEFLTEVSRLGKHIDSRYLRRRIPSPLLASARWVKRRLFRRSED